MIIDELIKHYEDKKNIVNKKRKNIFKQDFKEKRPYRKRNRKKSNLLKGSQKNERICNV